MSVRVEIKNLTKSFQLRGTKSHIRAVDDVSLSINPGSALGLVGESGSGKTTLGRCLLRLVEPDSGRVLFGDIDLLKLGHREMRAYRSRLQVVFQDPYQSLNPRMRIGSLIEEPLRLNTDMGVAERLERVFELLGLVRLERTHLRRFPSQLSGGQLQRVGIARAIALVPDFMVLDEPTSSLDLTVRAGVLHLLRQLQEDLGMTYLLISHDLSTVGSYCDDVAVMYLGSIVERGPAKRVFDDPQHPYTQALLSAHLSTDPDRIDSNTRHVLSGEIPSPVNLPPGCVFASRCPLVREDCLTARPFERDLGGGHSVACVRVDDSSNILSSR